MQVSCPHCGTPAWLAPSEARTGSKVRCRRCSLVYPAPAPESGTPAARPPSSGPPPPPAAAEAFAPDPEPPSGTGPEAPPPPPARPEALEAELFGDLEGGYDPPLPEAAAPPETPPPLPDVRGTSAIRAQDHRPTAPAPEVVAPGPSAPPAAAPEPPAGEGWWLRTAQGTLRFFRDLEAVRAWLGANPDLAVELSSDREHWRPPAAFLAPEAAGYEPTAAPAAGPGTLRTPTASRLTGTALRDGLAPGDRDRAGPLLWAASAGSTLIAFLMAALVMHNLGVLDVPAAPLDATGLDALARPRVRPQPEPTALERYQAEVNRAERAGTSERALDAVLAWRKALAVQETPEALEGLAGAYERLGSAERAADTRRRLEALRARRAPDEP